MKKLTSALVTGAILLAPAATASTAWAGVQSDSSQRSSASVTNTQAVRMAKSYLSYSAFSRAGLIKQLKYEGFTTGQATRAVDSIRVSWKKQAAKMAKSYLRYSAFSRAGLIEQLKYEGFTTGQAKYGVRAVGL